MNNENVLIYHHTDMDGYVSASQIVEKCKNEDILDIDNIPVNYPEPDKFPYPSKKYNYIYIVDVSFTEPTMKCLLKLKEYSDNIIWLDHHASSLELFKKNTKTFQNNDIRGIIDTKVCASVICFLYKKYADDEHRNYKIKNNVLSIFDDISRGVRYDDLNPLTKYNIPEWLYYVDQWDTWKHTEANIEDVLSFKYIFETHDMYNNLKLLIKNYDSIYTDINTGLSVLMKIGKYISKYVSNENKEKQELAFEYDFEGIKTLCINSDGNSMLFGDKIKEYDMCCLFNFNGKEERWKYSLYSENKKINCAKIAEKYKGGGHPGASGFATKKCLFL